ncbi:ester cyclase [Streptomyces sp. DSM 3412]|uniref:Ester cyclase n=1 Tax=Streptomyces gottesmaniae TaxID=3075518 RepID=A0ABU2Z142_9ACTN|nr:nuclear transport factor 2 family protein [Streptomyces sp. DSM 3412]MDT0570290.1 ester cyclase [Streptomyces sp. DSM 3412]
MTSTARLRRTLAAALVATALTATAAAVPTTAVAFSPVAGQAGHDESARLAYQKSVAVQVLKGVFEEGDTKIVDRYVRSDYIQHNPQAPDGKEPLKNLALTFPQQFPDAKYDVKRVISEGDLVVVHSNLVFTPGTRGWAVFDIFRFQGGKLGEHWDTGQEVPETTVNGNDMFSTLSRPRTEQPGPRRFTAYNKKLVTKAFDELLVQKDLSAIDRHWNTEYPQHSPYVDNGADGVKAGLGWYFNQFPELKITRKRVVAEGDLVAVHAHYVNAPGERGQAVVDLFRVRNGKIVEHWDVTQNIPETSANDNTMF